MDEHLHKRNTVHLRGDLARDGVLYGLRGRRRDQVVQPGEVGIRDCEAYLAALLKSRDFRVV